MKNCFLVCLFVRRMLECYYLFTFTCVRKTQIILKKLLTYIKFLSAGLFPQPSQLLLR